jgi:hypothetical protein
MNGVFHYARLRTKKLPSDVREAIFQNCVFLLSATLEDFIADVLAHWFGELIRQGANAAKLPESTRFYLITQAIEQSFFNYVGDGDEVKLASNVIAKRGVLDLADASKPLPVLDYKAAVVAARRFPSTKNFDRLFGRIGIAKMSARMNARVKGDFLLGLQSFMDVRNALAHEAPPPITDIDVDRHIRNVRKWINGIDRELYSHVAKTSGSGLWN